MIADLDIYRAANALVKRYGQGAAFLAIKRATEMLDAGDFDGYAVWKWTLRALEELERTEPEPGVSVQERGYAMLVS